MGRAIILTAEDEHAFGAYRADPAGRPRGGIVVVQEIFGVNRHIRAVADGFAVDGYLAVAPALFDRVERDVELGYTADDMARGRALRGALEWDQMLRDVHAAMRVAGEGGAVAVVGYCLGGSVAWLAATRLKPAAAVAYYGGAVVQFIGERPSCPVQMHFGDRDAHIPVADVERFKAAHPDVTIYRYPAEHGFNCNERASYDTASATLARRRTLDFLGETLAAAGTVR
jgi:carboxymethylenebutenolidase